jgi:PleD family two-component response regulator
LVHKSNNDNQDSIHDSTEAVIQRTIQGFQKMIRVHESPAEEEGKAVIQINPAVKRHFELEIKILRDAPRDEMKLRQILAVKQKEYEKAIDSEDIERLVPEIEMLKFVLFLVCRNGIKEEK